jgi:hypothetical protein
MAVEDGLPAPQAAAVAECMDRRTGSGGGAGASASMEVDGAAAAPAGGAAAAKVQAPAREGAMGQALREVPLLEGHLLRLRRKVSGQSSNLGAPGPSCPKWGDVVARENEEP